MPGKPSWVVGCPCNLELISLNVLSSSSYLGLLSGNYSARVDNEQLQKIFYSTKSPVINFTIDNSKYGDILDNLEFYLDPKEPQFDLYETIVKYFTF